MFDRACTTAGGQGNGCVRGGHSCVYMGSMHHVVKLQNTQYPPTHSRIPPPTQQRIATHRGAQHLLALLRRDAKHLVSVQIAAGSLLTTLVSDPDAGPCVVTSQGGVDSFIQVLMNKGIFIIDVDIFTFTYLYLLYYIFIFILYYNTQVLTDKGTPCASKRIVRSALGQLAASVPACTGGVWGWWTGQTGPSV